MISETIKKNLSNVQQAINNACLRAGRTAADVQLVAVTKYAEWEWVMALAACHTTFGENRPQQLAERQKLFPDANWHLIGQLQRNKAKLAVQHSALIHSVDSLSLLQSLANIGQQLQVRPRVLLQVNVSGELSKSGFEKDELLNAWDRVVECQQRVDIVGFMTMAPACEDPEAARSTFRNLFALREEMASSAAAMAHGMTLPELSMGMSGDFEVAVEEGATIVRVGSRLFEGV